MKLLNQNRAMTKRDLLAKLAAKQLTNCHTPMIYG